MVANNRDLTVQFKGDSSDLTRAAGESEHALGRIGTAASGQGGLLGKLTPVIDPISILTQGLGFLAGAAGDFITVATDGATSIAALDGVMKNVVHTTKDGADKQEAWLTQLSNSVGVIDDDLRPAFGRLISATGSVDTARDDLKLALDVAAGTGKDFTSVTDAFVKAANGNEGALSRLGINIHDKVTGNLLPLPDIIKNLQDKYGGLAATVADQDPLNKLSTAWHNIEEELGQKLLPLVQDAVDWIINHLIPAVENFAAWVKKNWPELKAILAEPISNLKTQIDHLGESLSALSGGDGKSGKLNLATVGMYLLDGQASILAGTIQFCATQLEGIVTAAEVAWIGLKWLADRLTGPMISAVGALGQAFSNFGTDVVGIATSIWQAFKQAFNWIIDAWNATLGKISIHIPGTGIGFSVPSIPHVGTMAVPSSSSTAPGTTGSVINVNLPSGTDGHAIVAALRTYNVRVGGLDLALNATR